MTNWMDEVVHLSPIASIGLKSTILLAAGWGLHFALKRSSLNPAWRMLMWRAVMVGLVAIPLIPLLGSWRVPVKRPELPPVQASFAFEAEDEIVPPIYMARATMGAAERAPALAEPKEVYVEPSLSMREWCELHTGTLLCVIWGAGAAFFLLRLLIGAAHIRGIRRRGQGSDRETAPIVREIGRAINWSGTLTIVCSSEVHTPCICGVFSPALILPKPLNGGKATDELRAVLAHEIAHLSNHDLHWFLASRLLSALLWFHPLVWRIPTAHVDACEEVCDATASALAVGPEPYSSILARTALRASRRDPVLATIPMARGDRILRRLRMLKRGVSSTQPSTRLVVASVAFALIVVTGFAAVRLAYPQVPPADTSRVRVLHFPKDRSLGALSIQVQPCEPKDFLRPKAYEDEWEFLANARGDVVVPAGANVRLIIAHSANADMTALNRLAPNDLYALKIMSRMAGPIPLPDSSVRTIAALTGLRILDVRGCEITGKNLEMLAPLQSLRMLVLDSDTLRSQDLRHLRAFQSLEALVLRGESITDSGLEHLQALQSLKTAVLMTKGVRGPGYAHLAKLPNLETLSLRDAGAGNNAMRYVKEIRSLRTLHLLRCPVTDNGVRHLTELPHLEDLYLSNTAITDACFVHFKEMPSLKRLNVSVRGITGAGLVHLKGMKTLEALDLPSTAARSETYAILGELTGLKELNVLGSSLSTVSDADLKHLRGLINLERLIISCNHATDESLAVVGGLTNLRELTLFGTDWITDRGLANLHELSALETLTLRGWERSNITVTGINQLNVLGNLKSLQVQPIQRSNAVLDIGGLKQLTRLWVPRGLQDEDLACLRDMKELRVICIGGEFSNTGVANLAGLTNVSWAQVLTTSNNVTDAGLAHIAGMKRVDSLNIVGCFTDKGLRHLEEMKALRGLTIQTDRDFSPEAIRRLRTHLPNLYESGPRVRERSTSRRLTAGDPAPSFELRTIDGDTVKLEELRGKVVLMCFWSSWVENLDTLATIQQHYARLGPNSDLVVIGISLNQDEGIAREAVKRFGLTWPQACVGQAAEILTDYDINVERFQSPVFRLIGRDSLVWLRNTGNTDRLFFAVDQALKTKTDARNNSHTE